MSIELPDAIEAYFSADKTGNAQAIAERFTQDATVMDEGNTYTGRDAIRRWMATASTQYTYTVAPFDSHGAAMANGRVGRWVNLIT